MAVTSLFSKCGHESCQSQVLTQMFFSQGHAADVFEAYTQLLTEMVLRLPYQIKKIADTSSRIPPPVFDHSWFYFLSEVSEGSRQCQLRRGHIGCDYLCSPLLSSPSHAVSPSRVPATIWVSPLWSMLCGETAEMCLNASRPLEFLILSI